MYLFLCLCYVSAKKDPNQSKPLEQKKKNTKKSKKELDAQGSNSDTESDNRPIKKTNKRKTLKKVFVLEEFVTKRKHRVAFPPFILQLFSVRWALGFLESLSSVVGFPSDSLPPSTARDS